MKTKTKVLIAVGIVAALILVGLALSWEATHGNRRLIDTKNRFDRAVIRLPNGEVVAGKVSSWLDYSDSDVVLITVEGKTYLTHYSNVCLIDD